MRFLTSLKSLILIASKTLVESNRNCYLVPLKYIPHCPDFNHQINKERDSKHQAGKKNSFSHLNVPDLNLAYAAYDTIRYISTGEIFISHRTPLLFAIGMGRKQAPI